MENSKRTKIIVTIIILLVLLVFAMIAIIAMSKGGESSATKKGANAKTGTISKANSEFDSLEVIDVKITYSEDETKTNIDFSIKNKSDKMVEQETVNIQLLDESNVLMVELPITIPLIEVGSSYQVPMELAGNITGIKEIKLTKPAVEEPQQ